MNKVLSLLLAFVFLQTQAWALSGGPQFGSSGLSGTSLIGVYSGALVPSGDETVEGAVNGLGLFSLSIPESGLGTGDFVYFSEGRTFVGTITGVADPDELSLTGLLKGQFDIITDSVIIQDELFGDASAVATEPGGFANGTIQAEFVPNAAGFSITSAGIPFAGLRIEGEASVEISEFQETVTFIPGEDDGDPLTDDRERVTATTIIPVSTLVLSVDGFRQSPTPGATAIAIAANNQQ